MTTKNLDSALLEAILNCPEVVKDSIDKRYNFRYASVNAVLAAARLAFAQAGVLVLPTWTTSEWGSTESVVGSSATKNPSLSLTRSFQLLHVESGESRDVQVPWPVDIRSGAPDAAFAKAMSMALKSVVRDVLLLPAVDIEEGTSLLTSFEPEGQPKPAKLTPEDEAALPAIEKELLSKPAPSLGPSLGIDEAELDRVMPVVAGFLDTIHKAEETTPPGPAEKGAVGRTAECSGAPASDNGTPSGSSAVTSTNDVSPVLSPSLQSGAGPIPDLSPTTPSGPPHPLSNHTVGVGELKAVEGAPSSLDLSASPSSSGLPTLTETLKSLGMTHRPASEGEAGAHDIEVSERPGCPIFRGRAGEVWSWLRATGRIPTKDPQPTLTRIEPPSAEWGEDPLKAPDPNEVLPSSQNEQERTGSDSVCDECGAPFKGSKGVATHKRRVHAKKSPAPEKVTP